MRPAGATENDEMGLGRIIRSAIGITPRPASDATKQFAAIEAAAKSFSAAARGVRTRFEADEKFFREARHVAEGSSPIWWAFELLEEAVLVLDDNSNILTANAATCRILGRPADSLVGKSVHDVITLAPASGSPQKIVHQIIETGRPEVFRGSRADGTLFPMEVTMTKVIGDSGEQVVVAFLRDTSEAASFEGILQQITPGVRPLESVHDFCYMVARGLSASMAVALGVHPTTGLATCFGGWRLEPHEEFGQGRIPAMMTGSPSIEVADAAERGRIVRRVQSRRSLPILHGADGEDIVAGMATAAFAPAEKNEDDPTRVVLVVGWVGIGPLRWLHIAENSLTEAASYLQRELNANASLRATG